MSPQYCWFKFYTSRQLKVLTCTNVQLDVNYKRSFHNMPWRHRVSKDVQLYTTLALEGGVWSTPCPGCSTPRNRPSIHSTRVWVGFRAGLDGYGKSCPCWCLKPSHQAQNKSLSHPLGINYTKGKCSLLWEVVIHHPWGWLLQPVVWLP